MLANLRIQELILIVSYRHIDIQNIRNQHEMLNEMQKDR